MGRLVREWECGKRKHVCCGLTKSGLTVEGLAEVRVGF